MQLSGTREMVPQASAPMASLTRGSYRYYLGKRFANHSVAIGFNPDTMALICQPEGGENTFQVPIQGITKAELMGELAVLQALPIYQLALPFSLAAWRQLEYTHNLTDTTLRDSARTSQHYGIGFLQKCLFCERTCQVSTTIKCCPCRQQQGDLPLACGLVASLL